MMRVTMVAFFIYLSFESIIAVIELKILHTGSIMSQFDEEDSENGKKFGIARLIHYVKQEKASNKPTVYLDSGDIFTGSVWYNVHRWRIVAAFVNIMPIDAMCLGDSEFYDGLNSLEQYLKKITIPVLCSNCDMSNLPSIKSFIKPYIVLQIKGVRIGVIGYLMQRTSYRGTVRNLKMKKEADAINYYAKKLRASGIKIIIVVGHGGYPLDREVATRISGVNVIVGGHTKMLLYNGDPPNQMPPAGAYPMVVSDAQGKKVLIVHAYAYTHFVGNLIVRFDNNGQIISYSGNPVYMDNEIGVDEEAKNLLDTFREQVTSRLNIVLGKSSVFLDGTCRTGECNLGNLLVDALVDYKANMYKGPYWTDTAIALVNAGSIVNNITTNPVKTNITIGDIYHALPFFNMLQTVTINGSTLKQVFEHSVHSRRDSGKFLQYSGVHVEYNIRRQPYERVVSCKVRCGNCYVPQYERVEDDKLYNVITTQYLADGGDGYLMLRFDSSQKATEKLSDLEVLREYIRYYGIVYPDVEERIMLKAVHDEQKLLSDTDSLFRRRSLFLLLFSCSLFY